MATPSVLTVPSMYGDGILYSGPTVYSNEIVVNGNFETDSDWNKTSGVTISNNKATINVTGGSFESLTQPTTYDVGEKYIVQLTIQGLPGSSGKQIRFQDDAGNLGTLFQIETLNESEQNFQVEWIPNAQSDIIRIARSTTSGDYSFTVSRVSIKKITQGSDFDFTRATTGTRINEDGYIEDVPYNLVTYSEDFTNWSQTRNTVTANTIIAPDGTLTADKIAANSTFVSNTSRVLQNITATNANTFSVFAKADEITEMLIYGLGSNNGVYFNLTNGSFVNYLSGTTNISSYNIENYNDGWNRFSVTFTTTNTRIEIYLSKNNSYVTDFTIGEGFYLWSAQLVKGDQQKKYLPTTDRLNLPRLNYPVYGGCPSLLMEPQRTNLFPYSNDYTQSNWTKANVTITENAGISPENLSNASKMIASANASFNYIYDSLTGVSSQYTISAFVKADGRNIVWLYTQSVGTNGVIYFDLSDESMQVVAGTAGTPTGTITSFPNGWYRITSTSHTFILSSGSGIGISDAKGSLVTTTDGTNGVLIYGLQIEAGSYPTSLMHTSTSVS
jgi:hypothetical protein